MGEQNEKIKDILKILLGISFILVMFLGLSLSQNLFTGRVVEDYYTYTKAICNEQNYCQDYEIVCIGNVVQEMNAINGAVVKNSEDWEDPREEDERNLNGLCNKSG